MTINEKLDKIIDKVACIDDDVKKITVVIGGSGLGDKGIIEQMQNLKTSHYVLESNCKKIKTEINLIKKIGIGISTIITTVLSALAYFKK